MANNDYHYHYEMRNTLTHGSRYIVNHGKREICYDHTLVLLSQSKEHTHSSFLAASWASLRRMPATPAPCSLTLAPGVVPAACCGECAKSPSKSSSCSASQCTACSGPAAEVQVRTMMVNSRSRSACNGRKAELEKADNDANSRSRSAMNHERQQKWKRAHGC